jgi:ssDNA-binding Zn-finger/Zn-ribbon topoisomerase 1
MVNRPLVFICPECGKPLRKSKSKYGCENSACSVIFVRYPNKPSTMEIKYKTSVRSMKRQT